MAPTRGNSRWKGIQALASLFLLLVMATAVDGRYEINVYHERGYIGTMTMAKLINNGDRFIPGDFYTLEIRNTEPAGNDYIIKSCKIIETGENIISDPGCLRCTDTFFLMLESSGYNNAQARSKQSLIHFKPQVEYMSFECFLDIVPPGAGERACDRGWGTTFPAALPLFTTPLCWGRGCGMPWWFWVLMALLLFLLLLCCLLALLGLCFRCWKKRRVVAAPLPTKNVSAVQTDRPVAVISATQTSNFDKTSLNRVILDASALDSSMHHEKTAYREESRSDIARLATHSPDKVEVFSGHAGVYNVRNGVAHQYQRPQDNFVNERTHTRRSTRFEDVDRFSFQNMGYDPDERSNNVQCVEGFDEVVTFHADREIGEYEHVEREFESTTTHHFVNDDAPPSHQHPSQYRSTRFEARV